MKFKRYISLILTLSMMVASINANYVFAETNNQTGKIVIQDDIVSSSTLVMENDDEEDLNDSQVNITAFNNQYGDVVTYKVDGGYIYFDKESQTIVDSDRNVITVNIPSSIDDIEVKRIGELAFSGCVKLTDINIPYGVEEIGKYCFFECYKLKSINLPNSLNILGEGTFDTCKELVEVKIPINIKRLETCTFARCENLKFLYLPNGLNYIATMQAGFESGDNKGEITNENYPNLTLYVYKNSYAEDYAQRMGINYEISGGKYSVDGGNIYFDDDSGFIVSCDADVTSVNIPSKIGDTTITGIDDYAFKNCYNIEDISMTDNIKYIGKEAFYYCSKLKNIRLSNSIEEIKDGAFQGCKAIESITIPQQVQYIGESAFNYCSALKDIMLPNNLLCIEDDAFSGCSSLETINIPSKIESIKDSTFVACTNLVNINIPQSVQTIGDYAFFGCSNLTDITLSSSLTQIGDYTFEDCSGLEKIIIPNSVEKIGRYAFSGCENLKRVIIPKSVTQIARTAFYKYDENTPVLYVMEGSYAEKYAQEKCITYNINGNNIIPVPSDDKDEEEIVECTIGDSNIYFDINNGIITGADKDIRSINIPEYIDGVQVKEIGDRAFKDCYGLEEVTLPSSIVSIGDKAFYECDFKSINLQDGIKYIGDSAFKNCMNLKTIGGLPSKLEHLGDEAFSDCQEFQDDIVIPATLKSIGNNAFYDDYSLEKLDIQNGVTDIGKHSFYNCSIPEIILPSSVNYIGNGAFSSCSKLRVLEIPKTVESIEENAFYSIGDTSDSLYIKTGNCGFQNLISYEGLNHVTSLDLYDDVESIGDNTFEYSYKLTSIKLPDSLKYIGNYAFHSTNIKTIDIPNSVSYIGKCAFYYCTNLTNVTLSSNLRYIMNDTFYRCENLKSIIVPSSVTSIGVYAFAWCTSLENIVILGKLMSIQDNAFYGCELLTNINITFCNEIGEATFKGCSSLTKISLPLGLEKIGNSAFEGCPLQSVSMPNSLSMIGEKSFSGCSNLTTITLPNRLTSIGAKAFENCSSISKIIIPQGVNYVGEYAFSDCTALTKVNVKSNRLYSIKTGVFYGCNNLKTVNIPSNIVYIGDSAFKDCALNSVSLSDNIKYIGDYAFSGCNFTELTLPKDLTYVGIAAFSNCKKLTRFTIPKNLTAITDNMFEYCSSLKTVTIPSAVKTIGENAFASCTGLETVSLSEGVETIDNGAFSKCSTLKSINIPTTVTTLGKNILENSGTESESLTLKTGNIGLGIVKESNTYITDLILYDEVDELEKGQFSGCDTLKYVSLPETLSYLPWNAFSSCDNLEKVNIKEGLQSIGMYAFSGCTKLESINIPDGVTSIGNDAFSGCSGISSIQIPLSIQSISSSAFANCTALSNVYYVGSNDDWSRKSYLDSFGNTYFINAEKHYDSTSNNGIKGDNKLELNTVEDNNNDDINDNDELVSFSLETPNYGVIGDVVQCTGWISKTDDEESVTTIADNIVYEISDTSIAEIQKSEAMSFESDFSRLYADIIAHKAGTLTIKGIASDGRTAETQITFEPQITLVGAFSNDDGSNEIIIQATLDYADSTYLEKFMSGINYIQSGSLDVTGENVNVAEDGKSATYSILIAPSDYNSYFTISSEGGQTLSTTAIGLKNRYYVPEEHRVSSEDVKNAAQDWVNAVNAYTEVLSSELDNAANEEFDNSAIIEEGARKLMEEDSNTNDKYLSFPAGISEEAQLSCYMAFYEAIISAGESNGFDFGTVKTGTFGTISTSSAIVKEIQDSITSIANSKRYTVNSKVYNVELSAFKFNDAYTGSIRCYSNKESCLVVVNSPTSVTAGVVADYIEAVRDLEISAVESIVKGLAQDLKVPSIETLTSSKVTKAIKKHSKLLSSKGFGEVDKFLGDIAGYYKYAKTILKYDKTNFAKDVNNLCEKSYEYLTNDSSTITNTAVKTAYSKVTTAADKLRSKCYSYLYDNEIDTDNLTFWDKITSFKCPVSISVYNKNDELIGYVDDNELWYSDEIIITRIGDEKKVYSTKDEPVHFKITGTDYGTLNCTFEEFTDGNPVGRSMFYDIALYDGKELSCTLDEADETAGVIYTEDGVIKPDEYVNAADYTLVNVSSSSDGNGETLGSGQYVKGDTVTLIALSDDDYNFAGWYADGNLVSLRSVYNFTAKEDTTVTALFVENQEYVAESDILYGDADNNGMLTANDASLILQKSLDDDFELPIQTTVKDWLKYVDVDNNGTLTANDASLTLQKSLDDDFVFTAQN